MGTYIPYMAPTSNVPTFGNGSMGPYQDPTMQFGSTLPAGMRGPEPVLPEVQPILGGGPNSSRAINAQVSYLNSDIYNRQMNDNLAQNYANQLEAYQLNGGRRWVGGNTPETGGRYITDAPVAPIYTNTNYDQNFAFLNSNTPGEPEYGTNTGYSLDAYLRQDPSYWGTLPQFTSANSNLNPAYNASIPNVGSTPTVTNPTGSLMDRGGFGKPVGQQGQFYQGLGSQNWQNGLPSGSNPTPGGGSAWGNYTPLAPTVPGQSGQGGMGSSFPTPPAGGYGGGLGLGGGGWSPSSPVNPNGSATGNFPTMPNGGFPFPWQPPGQQNTPYPNNGQPSVQNWTPPWAGMGGGPPIPGGGGFATPDQYLADQGNDIGYLRGMVEGAGYATDVSPAWTAMKEAQQRNIDQQAADLAEKYNVMGGRFSSAFGTGMSDFYSQTAKDQNATLGQMTLQSQEAARQRELQAAGQLASGATSGMQQLASQDYGTRNQQLQAALQAAMQAGQGSDQAAAIMAQLGASGAGQLQNAAMQGAGALYGAENTGALNYLNNSNNASMAMFNAQNQMFPQMMGYDTNLRQIGNSAATGLSDAWRNSLMTGSQLGQQQFGMDDYNLNRVYEEWLRTQPAYNPLIPYLYSAATAQPAMYAPSFKPSNFSQIAGGIGSLMGGIGSLSGWR